MKTSRKSIFSIGVSLSIFLDFVLLPGDPRLRVLLVDLVNDARVPVVDAVLVLIVDVAEAGLFAFDTDFCGRIGVDGLVLLLVGVVLIAVIVE